MRNVIRILAVPVLLASGWMAGRAETSAPEFTLAVDAPMGATSVVCVKGCILQATPDLGVGKASSELGYACHSNAPAASMSAPGQRCRAEINGWLTR